VPNPWGDLPAVKALKYPTIEDLHRDQQRLIEANYDDWNLITGRVGRGKSRWAIKNARKLDPSFKLTDTIEQDRIFWKEDDFWRRYMELEPGQAIILDEFDGHRRAAMHGERLSFLERMKRTRSRRVHVFVVYDRVGSLDRDMLTDRNAYWGHLEHRGVCSIRQPDTKLRFKMDGTPIEPTLYPVVGEFPFTPWLPAGWEAWYERSKHHSLDVLGEGPKEKPKDPQAVARVNMALVELAQRELARQAA